MVSQTASIRFTGTRLASNVYNINGRRYLFGNNRTHRVMPVYLEDIDLLLSTNPGLFERA